MTGHGAARLVPAPQQSSVPRSRSLLGSQAAAGIGAVLVWSSNALAASVALAGLPVFQLLTLQFAAATIILAAARVGRTRRGNAAGSGLRWRDLPVGLVGLTGAIVLQYVGFASASIVEANILAYTWPLFVAVWAALAHRSRQTAAGLGFAGVGFAGVALIFGAGGGINLAGGATAGYLAALGSAGCMAFYTTTVGRTRTSSVDLLLASTAVGTVLSLAVALAGPDPWQLSWSWAAAVYIGAGPMAGGFYLWGRAMAGTAARRLAPLAYGTPLLSTLLLIAAGETFTAGTLLGAVLVLICSVGVLVADRLLREPASA